MIDGWHSVQTIQLLILILYFLGLLGIGYLTTRLDASMEEYFLADRGLGAWLSGVSSAASSESGWVTLGAVGMGYALGSSAAWFIPGCLLGYCLNWYLVAPKLRKISRERSLITLPDFLEDRVNDRTRIIRVISVLIIFMAMCAYIGAQFQASGKLFSSLFFDESATGEMVGILVGAGFTILYTMFGGFRASAWTDLIQGLMIATGLALFPLYLITQMGGITGFTERLEQQPARGWISYDVTYPRKNGAQYSFRLGSHEQKQVVYRTPSSSLKSSEERPAPASSNEPLFEITVESNTDRANENVEFTYKLTPLQSIESFKKRKADEHRSETERADALQSISGKSVSLDTEYTYFPGNVRVDVDAIKLLNPGADLVDAFGAHNNETPSEEDPASESNDGNDGQKKSSSPVFPIPASLGFVLGLMGIGLGYPGMPHVLSRFMATRDQTRISQARVIALFWGSLAFYGAVVIGMLARVHLSPELIQDQENAFPILATELLNPVLSGVLVSAILAAIMSTADSMMIVASSAVSRDLFQKFLLPDTSQFILVVISRITVLVLGILGIVAAYYNVELIFWFVLVAWAILGASFGPPVILGLCWTGLTKWGVMAGMLTGGITAIVWKQFPSISQFLLGQTLYELIPAFLLSFLMTLLVSLLSEPPDDAAERMCR